MSLREYVHLFRLWLASKIAGFNVLEEIDAAYEAGAFYGKTQRFTGDG